MAAKEKFRVEAAKQCSIHYKKKLMKYQTISLENFFWLPAKDAIYHVAIHCNGCLFKK